MRGRRWGVMVVLLGLVGLVPGPVPAASQEPEGATPAVRVGPTGLVDGDSAHVYGTGWQPNTRVTVQQCPTGIRFRQRCERFAVGRIGDGGRFRLDITVETVIDIRYPQEQVDCRIEGACELIVVAPGTPAGLRVPLHFDPTGPDPPQPDVTVTPADGLVHAQRVQVRATGLEPGGDFGNLYADQCAPVDGELRCDYRQRWFDNRNTGRLDLLFRARTRLVWPDGGSYDCRLGGCVVRLGAEPSRSGLAPLTFAADGPIPPWPDITVSPNTALRDGARLAVEVRSLPWKSTFSLVQCPAERTDLDACSPFQVRYTQDFESPTLFLDRFNVRATFEAVDGTPVDCRTTDCVLHGRFGGPPPDVDLPLDFDPDAPLLSPRIVVRPGGVLEPEASVRVHGTGFVPGSIMVHQCVGRPLDEPYLYRGCGSPRSFDVGEDFVEAVDVLRFLRTRTFGDVDCRFRRCHVRVSGHGTQPVVFSDRLRF